MALKTKTVNRPQIDSEGFVTGKITEVIELDERVEEDNGKLVKYAAQFELTIEAQGTGRKIHFKLWTGQNLNNEKFELETGEQDYNRLTRLCLQTGLISENDLKSVETIPSVDIEQLEGKSIKFKLEKAKKNQALHIIKLNSIEIVE